MNVISVYDLKPKFQALLRPATSWLARIGVSANQITLAAAFLSASVGGLIAWRPNEAWPLFLLPAVLLVRMALNAIDGMLAREHGMKTPLGAILNELGDVVSDAALYLPLALVPDVPPALVVAFIVLAVMTEMSGVVAVQIGASRRYDGPFGKSDRALVHGILGLLLGLRATGYWKADYLTANDWIVVVYWVMIGLTVLTIVNRARAALAELPR